MSPNRRVLHFDSMPHAMEEARRLAEVKVHTTGHYSLGQILEHLARALDVVTGARPNLPVPWYAPLFGRLIRRWVIHNPPRPGFKLPGKAQSFLWPDEEVAVDAALGHLEQAYERFMSLSEYPTHPLFGRLSPADHQQLQCRHFELHLGFVHPSW